MMPSESPPATDAEEMTPACPRLQQVTQEEVLACQFSRWYDTFRNLKQVDSAVPPAADNAVENTLPRRRKRSNVTIDSVVLPLPDEFLKYLLSDGVRLPQGATHVSSFVPNERLDDNDDWSDDEHVGSISDVHNYESDDDEQEADECSPEQFHFPELNQRVEEAIRFLGGSVVPKLNWSCPKDATWINNGTLQCKTAGDVYLLLKSSDFVLHDVLHAFDGVKDDATQGAPDVSYEIVLRKWCNLHPSMEFRCFVWNRKLFAISQRNHTEHFSHVVRDRYVFRSQLVEFFEENLQKRFPSHNYCFDCYIDKRERVWLLDFNVWDRRTDSLLFSWDELMIMTATVSPDYQPRIRVVETELEVQQDPLTSYRAPIDTIELASSKSFEEFMKLCVKPSEKETP